MMDANRPLFIPLKRAFFEAFERREKTIEYRKFGPRWNRETCRPGRAVALSLGYGKARRLQGVITSFAMTKAPPFGVEDWTACYGDDTDSLVACIGISLS